MQCDNDMLSSTRNRAGVQDPHAMTVYCCDSDWKHMCDYRVRPRQNIKGLMEKFGMGLFG